MILTTIAESLPTVAGVLTFALTLQIFNRWIFSLPKISNSANAENLPRKTFASSVSHHMQRIIVFYSAIAILCPHCVVSNPLAMGYRYPRDYIGFNKYMPQLDKNINKIFCTGRKYLIII